MILGMNKKINLAWSAGIIDADGSIYISKTKATQRRITPRYIANLYVGNTSEYMVNELQRIFGGSKSLDTRKDLPNSKPFWHWNLGPKATCLVLKQIVPFLRVKKDKAKIAINFYKSCQRYKVKIIRKKDGTAAGTMQISKSEIDRREKIYQQMKLLNHKGI